MDNQNQYANSKPPTDVSLVTNLVQQLYSHVVPKSIVEINSYDDRNYIIKTENQQQFVLKVTNSVDTAVPGLIEGQNEMMLHLLEKRMNVPEVIKNVDGQYIKRLDFGTEKLFAVRLLTYLPGMLLASVPKLTEELMISCGEWLGKMTINLADFASPNITARLDFPWALINMVKIRAHFDTLPTSNHRNVVLKCVEDFEQNVLGKLDNLKYAYIHGDFNEQNILIKDHQVIGMIDFGDIQHAPRVFDLAIHIAYILITFATKHESTIELAPRLVIEGYERHVGPLKDEEMECLVTCVLARIAQSVTIGYHTHAQQPDNAYLLTTAEPGWKVLAKLIELDKKVLVEAWRQRKFVTL